MDWVDFQAKHPQVETTRMGHTKDFGDQAITPSTALAKASMAQAMVAVAGGDTFRDTQVNGAYLATATAAATATAVAWVVFTQFTVA